MSLQAVYDEHVLKSGSSAYTLLRKQTKCMGHERIAYCYFIFYKMHNSHIRYMHALSGSYYCITLGWHALCGLYYSVQLKYLVRLVLQCTAGMPYVACTTVCS
jgi:hypothetical protein